MMNNESPAGAVFQGRLAVQQRVLPSYRALFFDTLADLCTGGLSLFAGQPKPEEQIPAVERLEKASMYPAVNRHLFGVDSPYYICWQPGILEWLEKFNPDVLIVEANPRYPSSRKAIKWMHSRGRPVLGWGLGAPIIQGSLATFRMSGRNRFLCSMDGLIAYSQRGADEYRQLGFPSGSVYTAPNAVAPRPAASAPIRRKHIEDQLTVLFVGRLQSRKRIDLLLRACAGLPVRLQPRLWIVGDGPAREEYESQARQIFPHTEFLGSRFGSELESIFGNADLFVLPGTGGLAIQQAMSYGLPVIVAEGDGTQQDLVRQSNGWQIPGNDLLALTDALTDALSDLDRLRRMGAESYRIVSEEVNVERMALVFVEALNQIKAGLDK